MIGESIDQHKLFLAVERQILIDGLAANIRKCEIDAASKVSLHNLFKAWTAWSANKRLIRAMLRVGKPFTAPTPKQSYGRYTETHLLWFDGLIQELPPCDISLIRYEAFHKGDKHKTDRWAKQWKVTPRTYGNHLKKIREYLIKQIIAKAKRG